MEVTVAMLITSLVIGITYTVYTIVVKSFSIYQVKNNNMASLIRLDELLKNDFYIANDISKTQNGISIKNKDKVITYEIDPRFIVRTAGMIDTFKFAVQENTSTFEGAIVPGTNIDEEQNRIDDYQLILLFEDKKINYHYHKQYSSVNLIQRNTDAIH
jgi:hypothetical protein